MSMDARAMLVSLERDLDSVLAEHPLNGQATDYFWLVTAARNSIVEIKLEEARNLAAPDLLPSFGYAKGLIIAALYVATKDMNVLARTPGF
jgi:hypothetical protein